jgi:predicted transposase YdaD
VHGENWLGVALAALIKMPKDQAALLGAEALLRICEAPLSDQKRYLLSECVQAYLPMDEDKIRQIKQLLDTEKYSGVQAMNKTWFEEAEEKGVEKGIERGELKGRREMLQELMEDRFGPLPPATTERLEKMSLEELMSVRKAILRAQSLSELGLDQ